MIPAVPIWASLTTLPLEWAALALLTVGAIYWERSALSGIGIEGCVLSAMLGLCLGYEWSGSYPIAALAGVGASLAFALVTSVLLLWLRSDPVMGSFCLSLIPGAALILFSRQTPLRLLHDTPPPGLFRGTIFDGTYSEDLILNPWFLAAPLVLALAALVMLKTPYGLRLRGYSENPAFAMHGPWQVARTRLWGALLGALWAAPAAGILLRYDTEFPTLGLGYIALACAVAGRWAFLPGIALALGPALLRTLRPYAANDLAAGIALQAAPFFLALLYLIFLSRRALRAATTSQTRLDPDVL
jgi:simple sugar transport system permease protein